MFVFMNRHVLFFTNPCKSLDHSIQRPLLYFTLDVDAVSYATFASLILCDKMRFTHFLEVNGPFIIEFLGKREGLRIISSTCLETSWRRLFYKQMRLEYSQSTETSLHVIVFTT